MHELLHIDVMHLVRILGYPGIFAAIFLESGVFFGFFLPGASLLFTAGILAGAGVFNVWILIPLVTVAAIGGDNTGYWFGKKVGIRLFLKEDSRFFHHNHLVRAKDFYDRHGALAIMLARFVPIVRTFAPIVAGVVEMHYATFVGYNVAGALIWAAGVTFLGYFLGSRFPGIDHYLSVVVLLIIVLTCVPLALQIWREWKKSTPSP